MRHEIVLLKRSETLPTSVMRECKLSLTWRNDLRKGFNVSHLLVVELAPVYFAFHIFIYFSYFSLCMNVCAILRHIKRPKTKIWLFFLLSSAPCCNFVPSLSLCILFLYLFPYAFFFSLSFLYLCRTNEFARSETALSMFFKGRGNNGSC